MLQRRVCRVLAPILLALAIPAADAQDADWLAIGGDRGGQRYSTLNQIDRENVDQLQVAWTWHTGELNRERQVTIECTPLVIDGVMYITTGYRRVVALNAATGEELWDFDPLTAGPHAGPLASGGVNRGCAYWSDGKPDGLRRILHGTADGRLFCIDAQTGLLDPGFGGRGWIALRDGIEWDLSGMAYGPTSAPAICGDLVILGFSNSEGPPPGAPGDIRAFHVRTGEEVWRFHTIPRPGEFGHDTWPTDAWQLRSGANAWGGLSVDPERGIVFVGTGSAAFDFYGGDRVGDNLFANCTLALNAQTGERVWHFQTLHHDLWDHDLPTYPNLVTVQREGEEIPAAVQVTKTGHVFVFDRRDGTPLFDIREVPVPASDVVGEHAAETQPIPVRPLPFAKQQFNESDLSDITPATHAAVLKQFRELRSGPAYNPPSLQGTICIPGFHGGATWSGASYDPEQGLLFISSNNVPNITKLVPTDDPARPYRFAGYTKFLDPDGYPAIKPPWGVLSAVNLNTGEYAWQVTLGEHPELTAQGIPATGTENFGGTIATRGGLVFIGGTKDEKFRAFHSGTGTVLWEHQLDAGGYATPCTYSVAGRQYVCIAAGGAGKNGTKAGDAFVCFALP
jgi:quinoprotein glucose dehydrogenase